tara:strand:- start:1 stop:1512 length:1512 start_codon:yes stop_codon:yes gene_type:complete
MTLSTDTAATSIMADIEGWWVMTDGSGTTLTDISGNGRDATLVGTSTWETKTLGTVNRFDNDTTRGNNASTANVQLDLSTYTACFWVRHEELYSGTNNYGGAICLTYGPSLVSDLEIYTNSFASTSQYHQIVHNRANGGTQQTHQFSASAGEKQADNNNWVFWAITYDGTNVRQYKNGSLKATSGTLAAPISTTGKKIALNQVEDFRGLTCSMQNVRLYSRCLSATEVSTLYERPWEGIEYGDTFHHDPPAPASMLPLTSDSVNTNQIGWWPCTDGSGSSLVDISSGSNDGTAAGSATFETTSLGVAAEYDGSSSFHWLADSFSYTTDLTVSCWMRSDGTGVEQPAFCKGRSNGCTWWLGTNSSDGIRFATKKGGSLLRIDHDVASIADWHHLVLVQQATSPGIQAYVDGVSVYSGGSTGSLDSNSRIPMIGAATLSTSTPPSSIEDFEGNVANVRVWSRVLSADEIWSIYANPWLGSNYKLASGSTPLYNYIFRTERFRRLG